MLDLNGAPEQKEFAAGPIPPKSIVWVKIDIRPASGKRVKSELHPLLCKKESTGNHFIDCEFTVIGGSFEGLKFWGMFTVHGSEKAMNISLGFVRAAVEGARGIDPKDATPGAVQARQLPNGWDDFNGLEFPVKVGIDPPKKGDRYVNNKIMRAITPDKKEWATIQGGGEIITAEPIPEIPGGQPETGAQGSPGWAGSAGTAAAKPEDEPPAQTDSDKPQWAK